MAGRRDGDDLETQRRIGRELQGRLPKPRWPGRRRVPEEVDGAAELGCLGAELGPAGLLVGAAIGVAAAVLTKRQRRSR